MALSAVKIQPGHTNRILIWDSERLDGITRQHYWDRGDLKNRYVHYETVERHPRTTIVCGIDYATGEEIRLAEWDRGGRKRFLRNVHDLLGSYDIRVGHNIDRADEKWIKGDLHLEAGLPPLPPAKTVDTLKVMRTQFGDGAPFKSMDALCKLLGITAKSDYYDRQAMERAVTEKSKPDRDRLVEYCNGDNWAELGLYDHLRPFIPNHPALFYDGTESLRVCNRCGTTDELPNAKRYVANVMTYTMLLCAGCHGYRRLSIEPERMSIVRGV